MDWWTVAKPGRAGFATVLVALTWWGKASRTGKDWKAAVQEVVKVLSCVNEWRRAAIQEDGTNTSKMGQKARTASSVVEESLSPRHSKRRRV